MLFGSRLNRLATSIRRGISKYSVGSDNPGLVFDFIDNFYQKDKNQTVNFDGAITHARSTNAVMTDGYGPELVTVSSFSVIRPSANGLSESQTLAQVESGKVYVMTYLVLEEIGSSNTRVNNSGANRTILSGDASDSEGLHTVIFKANVSGDLTWACDNTGAFASLDNVSVREMPVLKWAPHNLLTYSEDLSQLWTVASGAVKSSTTETDPDGGNTAALITNLQNVDNARINRSLAITEDSTFGVFLKGTAGETINIEHGTDQQTVTLTSDWKLHTLNATAPQTTLRIINRAGCTADEVYFAFPHVFRSDLGGMVDNPDRGDSYVPTTSSAKYLPRIGHHVYNGSAWVNEGLLAESELRTNLWLYSNDPTNAAWSATRVTKPSSATITGPDGQTSGYLLAPAAINGNHFIVQSFSLTTGVDYTLSFYLKENGLRYAQIIIGGAYSDSDFANFDLQDGVIGNTSTAATATIQDVGNGWYRCSCTFPANATATGNSGIAFIESLTDGFAPTFTPDGTSGVYVYGAQLEVGDNNASAPTPSSYFPTSSSTASRAAETFTIPSANLPWPSPNYIGSELVDNGDFADTSDWTISSADAASEISGGQAYIESGGGNATLSQTIPTVSGNVYELTFNLVAESSGNNYQGLAYVQQNTSNLAPVNSLDAGVHSFVFVAVADDISLKFMTYGNDGQSFTLDDVSVREIDDLSVSIAMDGAVTYADLNQAPQVGYWSWLEDNSNNLTTYLDCGSSRTGQIIFKSEEAGVTDKVNTSTTYFSPDILVPYSIASRHGSTFVNGAESGVALTADTTPTVLADLSATDLKIAHDKYMGTIGTFRVWDKDLGDDGIVEATNPSLEPSLSLTFEGTGTNSFVVNNWSE